jgi:hypothetical protein
MASEFATENGHKVARLLKYYKGPPYNIPELLDAELQEVREVLDGLIRTAHLASWAHVTNSECDCKECCLRRAHALMEKLEVK